jgi:hypothetical protein
MRALRWTMTAITLLLVLLSGVLWHEELAVVDFSVAESYSIHYLGTRMYYNQVRPVRGNLSCDPLLQVVISLHLPGCRPLSPVPPYSSPTLHGNTRTSDTHKRLRALPVVSSLPVISFVVAGCLRFV